MLSDDSTMLMRQIPRAITTTHNAIITPSAILPPATAPPTAASSGRRLAAPHAPRRDGDHGEVDHRVAQARARPDTGTGHDVVVADAVAESHITTATSTVSLYW